MEIHRRTYYGGIEPCIRKQIWPYLLGHYQWYFTQEQIKQIDEKTQTNYEHKLSDWMAVEAIVRQRDKETTAANIAKLSGGGKKIRHYIEFAKSPENIMTMKKKENGHHKIIFSMHERGNIAVICAI